MIQQLLDEMIVASEKQKKEMNKINYKHQRRTRDVINAEKQEKLENKEIDVGLPRIKDKEEVYQELKKRFRMAWKSPGFKNDEFTKIPTLKGKILNEWEILRINLAERSYKPPQGFKGFKIPSQYQEFQKPKTPPGIKKQLDEFKLDFEDFVQRPSKYGKVHEDEMLEKVRINNKEPFRLTNSVQHNEFGFDPHLTWEAEMNRKQSKSKKLNK
ncbi:unnamed protein product [Paramecium pentaurelia]|uniref:Uncharacterized protein n=1 Tax=Paramecium pentaurelia TaxID=43138 RepID=A0A8S1TFQ9_9CILI|nr:unnamed protein product [Paramecium pentaurelia]